jgi:hypothetical protein
VVVRLVLFHLTTEEEMKLLPVTVSVKADPPLAAEEGFNVVATGTGLLAAEFIVKVSPDDVPPPGVGLKTVTVAVPAVAIIAAVIGAVSVVPDT